MDFNDVIDKHRAYLPTSDASEQTRFDMVDDFLNFFNSNVPNKVLVQIDGQNSYAIISDMSNRERIIEDKQMLTLTLTNAKCGSHVAYNGSPWLVLLEKIVVDKSHKSFVISQCNYTIQYQHGGVIYPIPSLVINKTSVLGVDYGEYSVANTGVIQWVISNNDVTKNIKPNTRIIIDGVAYEVTRLDKLSYKGLIILGCRETNTNIYDNEEVADNPTNLTIVGSDTIPLGSTRTYSTTLESEWHLSNSNAQIISDDGITVVLKGATVGEVDLIATVGTETYTKTIKINNSLF